MFSDIEKIKGFTVVIIVCVSSIIALAIMGAAIAHPYLAVTDTPSILENWGGIILGFYFGTFVGLLKEWLTGSKSEDERPEGGLHQDEDAESSSGRQDKSTLKTVGTPSAGTPGQS